MASVRLFPLWTVMPVAITGTGTSLLSPVLSVPGLEESPVLSPVSGLVLSSLLSPVLESDPPCWTPSEELLKESPVESLLGPLSLALVTRSRGSGSGGWNTSGHIFRILSEV